ncbi:MAG: GNAT family N-acetyltransferase [Anaerolineae bacterium]|nr:GNAT family N-acetyltransferase [Anaerolineae bacterium]
MKEKLRIREIRPADCAVIAQAFLDQGWHKPISQYEGYLREQNEGKRVVLVAENEGQFTGYLTILWESFYPPFREAGIPEIVDFNVLVKYQRRGIGTALMAEAEKRIARKSAVVGIGVGLMANYGVAQQMYVKRGYIPDGCGISQNERFLQGGDKVTVDDDLILCFTKKLNREPE